MPLAIQQEATTLGLLAALGTVDAVRCKHGHIDKHGHKHCILLVFSCGSSGPEKLVTYMVLA